MVLPAALWAEKTGCFTNADRTVHLSEKAVDPPGEARSDLDILLDYAGCLGLRDKDGAPLVKWSTPEQAWNAFTAITRGRPCDQSALTYDKLRGGGGMQWPCTEASPGGTERLYADDTLRDPTGLLRGLWPRLAYRRGQRGGRIPGS